MTTLPNESDKYVGTVHYNLADKTGAKPSFDVICFADTQPSIEDMLRTLDQQPLLGGGVASQRIMLWNVASQLPETSSKRAMLQWILINGEMMDLPKNNEAV